MKLTILTVLALVSACGPLPEEPGRVAHNPEVCDPLAQGLEPYEGADDFPDCEPFPANSITWLDDVEVTCTPCGPTRVWAKSQG